MLKDYKISDVGDLIRGVSYKKEQMSLIAKKGYIKLLRANNINGRLNENDLQYVPESIVKDEQVIKSGDILIAMSSGSKHLVGKSAVSEANEKRTFGAFCGLLRANKFDPFLLSKVLQTNNFRQYISEESSGSNINNLKREHILDFSFKAPDSLDEQKKLNNTIDNFLIKIESGTNELLKIQSDLALFKQSILYSAIRGKLVPQDPKDEPATKLLERIQKEKEKLIDQKKIKKEKHLAPINEDDIPFDLPIGWVWTSLGHLSSLIKDSLLDGPFGSAINTEKDYINEGIPVIRMTNIKPYIFNKNDLKFISDEKFQTLRRHNILPGDILLSKVGAGIGRTCIYPNNMPESMIATTGISRIRLHKVLDNEYLCYWLNFFTPQIKKISVSTAQPFLNMTHVKSIPIPLAPINHQKKISKYLNELFKDLNHLENSIESNISDGHRLKQSILKKAFEGEL